MDIAHKIFKSNLIPPLKFFLLALFDLAQYDGFTVDCPVLSIANRTGLSERTVQRQLRKLERLGLIEIIEPSAYHSPHVYKIRSEAFDVLFSFPPSR